MKVELTEQPNDAKVWVYQASREFNSSDLEQIKEVGDFFLNQWESHNIPVKGSLDVVYNRFLVFSAYSGEESMCGRAQSAQMKMAKEFEEILNLTLADRMQVAYKVGEEIKTVHFNEFPKLVESGEINENTIVFNNLVDVKEKYLSEWEIPVKDSWHSRFI